MRMKKPIRFLLLLSCFAMFTRAYSQAAQPPPVFHGAEAHLDAYKALYVLDESDDKKIKMVLRNISNALEDPRLKGKLDVELVAFGDGVALFKQSNHYDTLLLKLQSKGVLLAQCENTIRERKIGKEELWPFISYVPSGNGEIIIRHYQGWAIVHP